MAKEFQITDAMRSQLGKESPPWICEVTTTSVRAFARGVGYTDPVYFDIDAARKAGASEEELAETGFVAAALRAGGAVTHATHLIKEP